MEWNFTQIKLFRASIAYKNLGRRLTFCWLLCVSLNPKQEVMTEEWKRKRLKMQWPGKQIKRSERKGRKQ